MPKPPTQGSRPDIDAPAMLTIDLTAPQGQALLAATAAQFGAPLAVAAHRLSRLFLLRSPWAPGLRFVGGQAIHEADADALCDRRVFSMSGPAESLEAGLASCIGEGVELLSQIELSGDVALRATLSSVRARVLPAALEPLQRHVMAASRGDDPDLDWLEGQALTGGAPVLLPVDWCVRRAPSRTLLQAEWLLGMGVAAGPDRDWAASRALLELVERDAVAHWWLGGRRGRHLALHTPAMAEAVRLSSLLRQQQDDRFGWLLDLTTNLGIPCIAALSTDSDGTGLACGFAARLSLLEAVRAAVLENAQMELALLLARSGTGSSARGASDEKLLRLATALNASRCDLLHPNGPPIDHVQPPQSPAPALPILAKRFVENGIDAALVDLTRAPYGIAVVRAVAPQLQPMPSHHVTERLRRTVRETGGAERFTNGLTLF